MDTQKKNKLLNNELARSRKIGAAISRKRVERNMSLEELGQHIGVSGETMRKNEAGMYRVSAGRLSQIAETLEEPIATFFSSTNPERNRSIDEMIARIEQQFKQIKSRLAQEAICTIVDGIAKIKSPQST